MTNVVLANNSQYVVDSKGLPKKPSAKVVPFPNGAIPRKREENIDRLIEMGWVRTVDEEGRSTFYKHMWSKADDRRPVLLQLVFGERFETGLFVMKKNQSKFDLQEVWHPVCQEVLLTLKCYDFDAFNYADEYWTLEDMGEPFFARLMEHGYITEDEMMYFTTRGHQRKQLAEGLPLILMDVLSYEDMPQ